jgi:hypothetical protein
VAPSPSRSRGSDRPLLTRRTGDDEIDTRGYLGYRIVDAVFLALGILFLLLQILLGSAYLNAGAADASYLQALSAVSIQASQDA